MPSHHRLIKRVPCLLCGFVLSGSFIYKSRFTKPFFSILPGVSKRKLTMDYGMNELNRHEVIPLKRNVNYYQQTTLCSVATQNKSNYEFYGGQTQNHVVAMFHYEVVTKSSVANFELRNDYLPKIKHLIAQSFFQEHPICCNQYSTPMARINMISPESIISNITGVHAIVPHDTISDHGKF